MFKIDGITNLAIGVIAVEEDFLSRAQIRYEEILVDGMDGSIINELGYANVLGQLKLQVLNGDLDSIYSVFTGKRTLEFNERQTGIEFYDLVDTKRTGTYKTLTVNYIRHPFWFKKDDNFVTITDKVVNEGNHRSQPIIEMSGTGKVDVTINKTRFIYNFDTDGMVLIDCIAKTETWNNLPKSKNIEIGFEYPYLDIGENTIKIHSGNPSIRMKRKDVWL